IEDRFSGITGSLAVPDKRIFRDSFLQGFSERHQSVTGIFYLPESGPPYLLNDKLVYLPDDFSSVTDIARHKSMENILAKGWQIEFREENYPKALEYYQNILKDLRDEQSYGEILNIIARLQKRMKLADDAIGTYNLIWKEYPDILIQNSIPLGAVALLENSLLSLGKNDSASALETAYLLLAQLQKPAWEMEYSHFSNFLTKTDELLSSFMNQNNKELKSITDSINELQNSISSSVKRTGYLTAFIQSDEIADFSIRQGTGNHRFKASINGKSYFFSIIAADKNGQWGLIIDQDDILNNAVYHSICENTDTSKIGWELTDANGEQLLKSEFFPEETSPVGIVFPSYLPSWSLTFYPEYTGLFNSLFRPGAGIFLYIFIAIVVILAFGLFFTLQTVNNEMHLSKMKSYFMSTVSHEFKSPLTSIRQMAEMLVHGRVPSSERQHKYHTTILQQSERLSHLIDNILDFSKMENGQKVFHFVKADITPVVENIVESFKEHTAIQGFSINLSIPEPVPEVVFDNEAMEQVLHNLLDNACKYSGDSRDIEVQLLTKGESVIITVTDHGIGIRKEDLDKIFSRFYRAGEELTQTVKGSGIGLTIVKQIVETHNGTIDVESEAGKGSVFRITIPFG
ncbi:MAG TPA: HAMP domain-containing sensor histidine kinase, partial [Bacteroidales bacterium]|nr:HAMP domain-containing sensor histidine kinase [Bacteroidales bacterium]